MEKVSIDYYEGLLQEGVRFSSCTMGDASFTYFNNLQSKYPDVYNDLLPANLDYLQYLVNFMNFIKTNLKEKFYIWEFDRKYDIFVLSTQKESYKEQYQKELAKIAQMISEENQKRITIGYSFMAYFQNWDSYIVKSYNNGVNDYSDEGTLLSEDWNRTIYMLNLLSKKHLELLEKNVDNISSEEILRLNLIPHLKKEGIQKKYSMED